MSIEEASEVKPLESQPSTTEPKTLEAPSPTTTEPKARRPKARRSKATLGPKLREIFKDFDPTYHTEQKSKDKKRVYATVLRIVLKDKTKAIPLDKFLESVRRLMQEYPDKGYYLQGIKIGRRTFQILGREAQGQRDIALYHNVKTGKLYFEEADIKKSKSLAVRVLSYRLGALGIPYTTQLVSQRRVEA